MRFKSRSGGHVRIFRFDAPLIDINEGESYETSDKDEIEVLKDSPDIMQDRSQSNDVEDKDDDA
jgi:hypothetical protein